MRDADRLLLSYVLPLATTDDEDVGELAAYLRGLATRVDDVIVVDGSSPRTVDAHRAAFGPAVPTITPDVRTLNGKVGNVVTGVGVARHPDVVLADDDVRYELDELRELRELQRRLATATVVRPQNRFEPLPWHARIDAARTLLTRVTGGDWPGTLAIRRDAFIEVGGYAGDVLFENLELVRTLRAAGGTEHLALDVVVRRLPPAARHFRGQQVRQAYDELARPMRLIASLAVARRRPTPLPGVRVADRSAVARVALAVLLVGCRRVGARGSALPRAATAPRRDADAGPAARSATPIAVVGRIAPRPLVRRGGRRYVPCDRRHGRLRRRGEGAER